METTIPVFFFRFLFKILFLNESFDLTPSFLFINLTTVHLLGHPFRCICERRGTGRDSVGAVNLPEQLETFPARFPIDFLPCKFFWKDVVSIVSLPESFLAFPIDLWPCVREVVN